MKGYKALNMDMSSKYGNMIYEVGKKYTITGELEMCENGFHFCKCLEDVECYYTITKSRIFEVEAEGEIIDKYNQSCTESIILIRELSKEEIRQYFADNKEHILKKSWYCIKALADQGLCLDKLVNDENSYVRIAVARQGYGLETLIHDKDPWVRVAVVKQKYGLDILIHDLSPEIRMAVACQGYGLNILANDENMFVRMTAAMQKHNLNK